MGEHIELPENVRAYLIAGTQHGGGPGVHAATPDRGICQNLNNPLAMGHIRLALNVALYEWVAEGIEPPPSRYPTVANGGLVPIAASGFPKATTRSIYTITSLYHPRRAPHIRSWWTG